ncbi:MAG: type II toxin-antitoxin system HicB family antitoxin [Coriobacteriia bacterium]|nr:type II toxin-antitoxin system HicB family antitoxin [Coriobacteriia bacterium]
MKVTYPVILEKTEDVHDYLVTVPDLNNALTEGDGLANALYMAQDLISLICVENQDEGKPLPSPTPLDDIPVKPGETKTLVAADLDAYRKMLDEMAVKKTLTIPSWLNEAAKAAHINFSATLAEALKEKLGVCRPKKRQSIMTEE